MINVLYILLHNFIVMREFFDLAQTFTTERHLLKI